MDGQGREARISLSTAACKRRVYVADKEGYEDPEVATAALQIGNYYIGGEELAVDGDLQQ